MTRILTCGLIFSILTAIAEPKTEHIHFQKAYEEISAMLDGKTPLNFKRAVFLAENAYTDNSLDYEKYNRQIAEITIRLKRFIKDKNLVNVKAGGNYAIFSYMKEPTAYNNNITCGYNFDDFFGKRDLTNIFVTKLLDTKIGTCQSLPVLYKILANEIKTDAFLAFAPIHSYIKHKDNKGNWVNVELTSGGFPSDSWLIQSMNIPIESIQSGVYLKPQTEKETVLFALSLLALYYQRKYGNEDFVIEVCNKMEKYAPQYHQALVLKSVVLGNRYKKLEAEKADIKIVEPLILILKKLYATLDSMGYYQPRKEEYAQLYKEAEGQKIKMTRSNNQK